MLLYRCREVIQQSVMTELSKILTFVFSIAGLKIGV